MTNPPTPPFRLIVPDGDDRPRHVCGECGFVHYVNPKIVVGSVIVQNNRILLCKRAIEPRRGFWTLPAGFLEENESVESGAMREAREEACADIAIEGLLAIYSIPRISQVQLMFRARLIGDHIAAGPESLEVGWFAFDDLPQPELAFPSVAWAIADIQRFRNGEPGPFFNPT